MNILHLADLNEMLFQTNQFHCDAEQLNKFSKKKKM